MNNTTTINNNMNTLPGSSSNNNNNNQSQQPFNNNLSQSQQFGESLLPHPELEGLLLRNGRLTQACRELSFHYKWVFQTLSALSPPVDLSGQGGGGPPLPFVCLSTMLLNNEVEL